MAAQQLGQTLSDGSFWAVNLFNTTSPPPSDEGFLTINLTINRTCRVMFQDEHRNPICSEDFGLHQSLPPTPIHFPGTMTRAQYYSALHHRLEHLNLDEFRLPGDDIITNFTHYVIDRVFARSVNLHEKLAICVGADLCRVSLECAPIPIEFDDPIEFDQDDPIEFDQDQDDEIERGLPEYFVRMLSDCCAVVAAEEHREVGDCSICLDGLFPVIGEEEEEEEGKKILFESPCGHLFHDECMTEWLMKSDSDSCPLCRFCMLSAIEE